MTARRIDRRPAGWAAVVLSVGIILTPGILSGCHSSRSARADRGVVAPLPSEDAWPERDVEAVRGFHERTPEVLFSWELNGRIPEDELGENERAALAVPDRTIVSNTLSDRGLLRVWSWAEGRRVGMESFFGFRPNASFLTSRDATGYRLERELAKLPEALGEARGERNFWRPGLQQTHSAESILLDEGITMRLPQTPGARGTMIVLGGLLSTEWQERVIARMEKGGWAILHIDPAAWVRPPNDEAIKRAEDEASERSRERSRARIAALEAEGVDPFEIARSMPSAEELIAESRADRERHPLPPNGFELGPDTDEQALGRLIARHTDDTIAEVAYAAEAAVAELERTLGRGALGPVALMGFSAGSMSTPAVAARLRGAGHRVDAMILIGAGADLFDISQTSTLGDGGIRLAPRVIGEPRPELPAERLVRVNAGYLRAARLDPHALAPALRDLPTLLVLGSDDSVVPNGDLLDKRLGYPDRITYRGGHGGLFYFLPGRASAMLRWLDRVAPDDRGADPPQR